MERRCMYCDAVLTSGKESRDGVCTFCKNDTVTTGDGSSFCLVVLSFAIVMLLLAL